MSAPNTDLVADPKTPAQFQASAVFCRKMAAGVLGGKLGQRDAIAKAYLAQAKRYEGEIPQANKRRDT